MTPQANRTSIAEPLTILDQLEYNVLVTDRDGRIEYVNAAFERSFGYTRDEVVGCTPTILKSGVHGPEVYAELWQTLLAGKPYRAILTNRKKTGELIEEAIWISIIRDARGEISHFVSLGRMTGESRRTYDLFTLLADSTAAGVYILQDEKFAFVNAEFQRYTGYSAKELIDKDRLHLVLADDRELVSAKARAMLAGEEVGPYEYRLLDKQGNLRWVLEKVRGVDFLGLRTERGSYVAGTMVDITDRKRAEEQLQEALSVYAATIESTTDGILVLDTAGTVRQVNTRFMDMWGLSGAKVFSGADVQVAIGLMLPQIRDTEGYTAYVRATLAQADADSTDVVELKDGRVFEVYSKPQLIEGETAGRVWSFRDVTERRQFEAALMHMANYDALTGLLNRRRFQEEMEESLAALREKDGSGSLILLDVDRFKRVNDSLGHQAGDEVLAELGEILRSDFRGQLVARFGGEEFAVFLPNADTASAQEAAKRLARALARRRIVAGGAQLRITMSMGIAAYPIHGESVSELFSHADVALYDAKYAGRNRISLYSAEAGPEVRRFREAWRHRVQDAVENDGLTLLAQPLIFAATGQLRGYELLARLRNADGSLLAAKEFIPVAEQLGLIHQIDEWVVGEAIALLGRVQAQGCDFRLGVNLGGWAFADSRMLELLQAKLRETGVDPSAFVIEMPETSALSDMAKARRFIATLRSMGCRVALDDFGVGYASFDYLKRLPIDIIKIDGSFIRDLTRSSVSREIVSAIVTMAKGLGVDTVAESVHNEATFRLVRELGINIAQGYWVGRPRKATALTANFAFRKAA